MTMLEPTMRVLECLLRDPWLTLAEIYEALGGAGGTKKAVDRLVRRMRKRGELVVRFESNLKDGSEPGRYSVAKGVSIPEPYPTSRLPRPKRRLSPEERKRRRHDMNLRRYWRRRADGLCVQCGAAAAKRYTRCQSHHEKHMKYNAEKRRKRERAVYSDDIRRAA